MDIFQADSKEEIFIEGLPLSIISDSPSWTQECHSCTKFFLCIAHPWCPGQNHRKTQKNPAQFFADQQFDSPFGEGLSSVLDEVCHSLVQLSLKNTQGKTLGGTSLGGMLKLFCYSVVKNVFLMTSLKSELLLMVSLSCNL